MTPRAESGTGGRASRRSKGQRRIEHILSRIPAAREQLLAAMERFGDEFELERLAAAALSDDAARRNDVAPWSATTRCS